MPKVRDLADLNAQLLAACREDERRQIAGRSQPVGAAMIAEREHLLPSVEQGFELAEISFPRVDGLGCVRVRTNLYSVPAEVGGADHLHRRQWHRQNPSAHGVGGGGLPAEAPSAIRYGCCADQ